MSTDTSQKGHSTQAGNNISGSGLTKLVGMTIVAFAGVVLLSLWGRYPEPGILSLKDLQTDELALRIFVQVRLPRMAGALLLGAVLALAGTVFQYVFANPLVDSGFLGVSQGAGLGAIIAMLLGFPFSGLLGLAFVGALLSLAAAVLVARKIRFGGLVLRLVLAGIAVSSVLSALIALIKFTADPLRELPEITYWLMGGLSHVRWHVLALPAGIAFVCATVLVALRWKVGLLALDDAVAKSLAPYADTLRFVLLVLSVVGTASVTAYAGIVSWAGLIVPHIARLIFGADTRRTVPAAIVLGGLFMALCDTIARALFPVELPLGVVTALLGSLVFAVMLVFIPIKVARA